MEGEDCRGTCPGHPCPEPLSAGWRCAGVAAAPSPSQATCAQAGGPGRARIRELIHPGFQTSDSVPGDREGRWEASPPTTPNPPQESPGHCLEGSPEPEVACERSSGLPGPSFLAPAPPCHCPAP